VRVLLKNKPFEETPVEIEAFFFLDSQIEIVDLRA
jgi:hypothetical protein